MTVQVVLAIWLLTLPPGVTVTIEEPAEPTITLDGGWASVEECVEAVADNLMLYRTGDERAVVLCVEKP